MVSTLEKKFFGSDVVFLLLVFPDGFPSVVEEAEEGARASSSFDKIKQAMTGNATIFTVGNIQFKIPAFKIIFKKECLLLSMKSSCVQNCPSTGFILLCVYFIAVMHYLVTSILNVYVQPGANFLKFLY